MGKRKILVGILLIFLAIIYLSINATIKIKNEFEPPMWKISKDNKEFLAIATLYNMPKEKAKLGYKIKKCMKNVDYLLVVEDTVKDASYAMEYNKKNRFKSTVVKEFLSEEEKLRLKELCKILGIEYYDIIEKNTGEALNIIWAYKKNYVFKGEQIRLSNLITEEFYKNKKLVVECESYDEKIELLNKFKDFLIQNNYDNVEDDEFKMLINSDFSQNLEIYKEWYNNNQVAYASGDVEKLEADIEDSSLQFLLYKDGLKARNKNIYKKIIKRREHNEGTPLLAFEINFLLGENGILNLFREDGYLVERIN